MNTSLFSYPERMIANLGQPLYRLGWLATRAHANINYSQSELSS